MKISLADTTGMNDPDSKRAIKKTSVLKIDGPWSVGIEYELENLNPKLFNSNTIDRAMWEGKADGSLRGGNAREYIFKAPLSGDDCVAALENIYTAAKNDMTPFMSLRTSAHIHVNCLDLSIKEALLFAAAGVMLENHIYTLEDPYRKWCGFCAKSDEYIGQFIENALEVNGIPQLQVPRYLGINVMALRKFGTIEFRQFSVPVTLEQAVSNVNLCMSLKKAAIQTAEETNLNALASVGLEEFKPILYTLYEKLKETHGAYAVETPDLLIKYAESAFHEKNERWISLTPADDIVLNKKRTYVETLINTQTMPDLGQVFTGEAPPPLNRRAVTTGTWRATNPFLAVGNVEEVPETAAQQAHQFEYRPYMPMLNPDGKRGLPDLLTFIRVLVPRLLYLPTEERRELANLLPIRMPNQMLNPTLDVDMLAINPNNTRLIEESGLNRTLADFLRAVPEEEELKLTIPHTDVTVTLEEMGLNSSIFIMHVAAGHGGWRVIIPNDLEIWKFIIKLQMEVVKVLMSMRTRPRPTRTTPQTQQDPL